MMKPYPTLHWFLMSHGRYRKSYVFGSRESISLARSVIVYLLGMFRIITVVRGSLPISVELTRKLLPSGYGRYPYP